MKNRDKLMQQSMYDLLVKINAGMLAGYDCIMDVFDESPGGCGWGPPLPSCCYACDLREVCFDDDWCPKRKWDEVRGDAGSKTD